MPAQFPKAAHFSKPAQRFAVPAAALALMAAFGLPAHAGGEKCSPPPIQCSPAPQCHPVPQCGPKAAVPEPASVALVGVGVVALLPTGMRAIKSRRQVG